MPNDEISVTVKCKKCGSTITWPDDAVDSTEISCSNCGEHIGTYGELKEAAVQASKDHIESKLKDIFKGLN